MTPRRLMLIRHAKAEPFAATDHARELTDRGRRDALGLGEYLADRDVPDYAVVSPSARTRATWELIAEGSGSTAEVVYDDAVFSGSPDVVLDVLRDVPDTARALAFVGHNPTVAVLAHLLEDGTGDPSLLQQMTHGFPPGSLAVFETEVSWSGLAVETGRLVDFRAGGRG